MVGAGTFIEKRTDRCSSTGGASHFLGGHARWEWHRIIFGYPISESDTDKGVSDDKV